MSTHTIHSLRCGPIDSRLDARCVYIRTQLGLLVDQTNQSTPRSRVILATISPHAAAKESHHKVVSLICIEVGWAVVIEHVD